MEFIIKSILFRRSCRLYSKQFVAEETICHLISAASMAPSGKNIQPWRFKVVNDRNIINIISEISTINKWMKTAPCIVAVFLDTEYSYDLIKDSMAIGAAIQNLLLEANAAGLSTCWVGECINKEDSIKGILNINGRFKLMAIITIGYCEKELPKTPRKKVEELIL